MPVINGVYTKDFPDLGRTPADADIIPIAEVANQITYKTTIGAIFNAKISGTTGRITKFTGSNTVGNSILNEIGNVIHLTDGTSSYASFGIINPGTPGDPGVDNDCYIGSTINNDFTFRVNNVEAGRFDTALRFKISNIPNAITDTDQFLVSDGGIVKYRTASEMISDLNVVTIDTNQTITGQKTFTADILANAVTFDPTPATIPTAQGSMYFDEDNQTIAAILNGSTMKIGEDLFFQVKNQSGSPIAKGTALRFDGVVGSSGRVLAVPFLADGTYPSIYFLGVAYEDIANGADGKALWFGNVRGVNTNAYAPGTVLYASTSVAGGYQTTAPVAPNNIISVAAVVTQGTSNGQLLVRPLIGSNINNDEGVKITSPTTGDLLQLQSSGLWENKSANNAGLVTLAGTQTITGAKTFSLDSSFNGVSIGRGAGNINTNTRVGLNALSSNTTGNANSAFGSTSLSANTTGHSNNAFGFYSLYSNISGYYNVGVGNYALGSNDTGHSNTAIGQEALTFNTSGYENVGVGIASLLSNTTGFSNTAVGSNALRSNTTGGYNTAVGDKSLYSITTGIYNTALGNTAGDLINSGGANQTSNYSVYLGYDTRASANGNTNEIVIGSGARGNGSNTVTIGNSSITDNYFSGNLSVEGLSSSVAGSIRLKMGNTASTTPNGYASIAGISNVAFDFINKNTSGDYKYYRLNSVLLPDNTLVTYSLPSSSGTLALTSNIASAISGTTSYIPKFTGTNSIGNSQLYETASGINIGSTTDAGYKLDVNGTGRFSGNVDIAGATYPYLSVIGNSSTTGGGLRFYGTSTQYAEIYGEYESSGNGQLFFRTRKAGTITQALQIASTGAATFSSSVTAQNAIINSGTSNNYINFIQNSASIGYVGDANWIFGGSISDFGIRSTNNLVFGVGASERMRILSTGQLVKYGDSTSARIIPAVDNVGYVGDSGNRWQAIYAVNGTIQTSDGREKTNINDSDLGLDFITKLRPVSYKWIVGENIVTEEKVTDENGEIKTETIVTPRAGVRNHYGFIAQEIEQALDGKDFGGFVYDNETDKYSLRYSEFISPIIKAIQEQNQLIQELNNRIIKLENN